MSPCALMKVRVNKVPINGARLMRSGPSRVSRSISVSLPAPHAATCHLGGLFIADQPVIVQARAA